MDFSQPSPDLSPSNALDTAGVYIKGPPTDEEPFDVDSIPPTQEAPEPTAAAPSDMASPSRDLSEATATTAEPQLWERSTEDLIAMIQNLQASHAQELAELRDQQAALSNQLNQLKSLLDSHFNSQLGAINSLQSSLSSFPTRKPASRPPILPAPISAIVPAPSRQTFPAPSQPPIPSSAMSVTSTPAPTPHRELFGMPSAAPPSPTAPRGNAPPIRTVKARTELRIEPSANPEEPPVVHASHIDTVAEVWEEFRYGRAGNTAIEKLDLQWGPRWRQDHKLRTWYQRRKLIADRIKLYMADGIDEKDAVMEVEKMRRGRSLNWVSRILGEDAKETRKQRKVAAQQATAARQALRAGLPAV